MGGEKGGGGKVEDRRETGGKDHHADISPLISLHIGPDCLSNLTFIHFTILQ